MCQAYDGERRMILALEDRATIEGFAAARSGKPKSSNPFIPGLQGHELKAWGHGWDCWHARLLPWVLEREFILKEDYEGAEKAVKQLRDSATLPSELEKLLE